MAIEEHLTELRRTMIRVMVILAVSFVLTYATGDIIGEFLLRPLKSSLAEVGMGKIVYLGLFFVVEEMRQSNVTAFNKDSN